MNKIQKPYSLVPHPPVMFEQMQPIHSCALQTMIHRGIASIDERIVSFDREKLLRFHNHLRNQRGTTEGIEFFFINPSVIDFIRDAFDTLPLLGTDGLKDRTKLMGYKYDAV